jgi:hypothetical protein
MWLLPRTIAAAQFHLTLDCDCCPQVSIAAAKVLAAGRAGQAHMRQRRLLREGRPAGRLCYRKYGKQQGACQCGNEV